MPTPSARARPCFAAAAIACVPARSKSALEDFERAIELLPDFAEAVASHAECLDMLGRVAPAQPEYEKARQLWAERAGRRAGPLLHLFRQQGRLTFEVESYELALERIKTGSFPLSASGNALLARGQAGRSAALLRAGRSRSRKRIPRILALKGEALSMLGRYRQAVDAFSVVAQGQSQGARDAERPRRSPSPRWAGSTRRTTTGASQLAAAARDAAGRARLRGAAAGRL